MTDQLLLDFDPAFELHVTMTGVADELDTDRSVLAGLLADAERFLGVVSRHADDQLRAVAELLRTEGDDLARRLRMIALGGPEINAGLGALEAIRANWDLIDNKGDVDGNDGIVSRSDLEWAAEHLDGDTAAAARWLLDHPEFFAAVETAKQNSDYLADGGAGFAAADGDTDGKLSLGDIDSYLTKLDTWATLVPYMASIDVAAHGGDLDGFMSKADFEAFLDDQTLPPQVRQAAQQVLDDSAFHESGGIGWDDVLMVASFIPVVGDFIDGAMALYYLAQGDWEQAALSGIGLIPIPGFTGGTARGARAAAEELTEEIAERTARESVDDLAGGIAATGRRSGNPADNLTPAPATTTAGKAPDPDDLTPTPVMAGAASPGTPRKPPNTDDLAEVPAMSGARHADNAAGGPPSRGAGDAPPGASSGGRSADSEPPPSGQQSSEAPTRGAEPREPPTPPKPDWANDWRKIEPPSRPPGAKKVNWRPDAADSGWGLTRTHVRKHMIGNNPQYSLRLLDPGGDPDRWFRQLYDLAGRKPTRIYDNGVIEIEGVFPRADGSGLLNLGIRLFERSDGSYDLVTILTRQ